MQLFLKHSWACNQAGRTEQQQEEWKHTRRNKSKQVNKSKSETEEKNKRTANDENIYENTHKSKKIHKKEDKNKSKNTDNAARKPKTRLVNDTWYDGSCWLLVLSTSEVARNAYRITEAPMLQKHNTYGIIVQTMTTTTRRGRCRRHEYCPNLWRCDKEGQTDGHNSAWNIITSQTRRTLSWKYH